MFELQELRPSAVNPGSTWFNQPGFNLHRPTMMVLRTTLVPLSGPGSKCDNTATVEEVGRYPSLLTISSYVPKSRGLHSSTSQPKLSVGTGFGTISSISDPTLSLT